MKMPSQQPSTKHFSEAMRKLFDPLNLTHNDHLNPASGLFDSFAGLSSPWYNDFVRILDPFGINNTFLEIQKAWLTHPEQWSMWYTRLGNEAWNVQLQTWQRFCGCNIPPAEECIPPISYDERFQDTAWQNNPYLDNLKEFYLLYTRWIEDAIYASPDVPDKTKRKAGFWARQVLNAIAPTNFFWTNPVAIEKFVETGGQSLVNGLNNLLQDSHYNTIRMTEDSVFKVGSNLALTPGAVVYRTPLFELLQYSPETEQVRQIPLVFIPPWINKYYILDLNERKSMVQYLVKQGYTVFMISWKNPDETMRNTTLDDYMLKGALEAINVAKNITGAPQVNAVGYCIGGIILTALMAWLNDDLQSDFSNPVASWSLFATLVDFSNPGDIDVFIDENTVQHIEALMQQQGYLDGKQLADSFRMLRSNSLIWHYFVHNYLYGDELPQFDVLAWNMDSTRLPQAMHSFYLREFYLNNKLIEPNGVTLGGRGIDLSKITQPLYAVGTEQDHIAPWKETFKVCHTINAPVRYALATSGHIMGIISPPVDPPKRRYWVGDVTQATDAETWCNQQEKVSGSWWEDWHRWLAEHSGDWQSAPSVGNNDYPALGQAPGSYVLES